MSALSKVRDDWEVSPPVQLDEAFALLRALPLAAFVWWVVGAAPMVLGLLFFWSDLTRGGPSSLTGAEWALVLTILFVWLKIAQAFFARAVWARLLSEGGLAPLKGGEWFRRTGALLMLGAATLPVQAVSAPLVFPLAWVFAFFHHATALAYTNDLGPRPWRRLIALSARLSHHEPLAHHFYLMLLGVLGVLVWGAVYVLGLVLPYFFKILTGMESEFTRNPLAVASSSLYVVVTVSVAWMLVSPYVRAAYVMRTFHVLSRRTGDDLLGRLQAARHRALSVVAAVMGASLLLAGLGGAEDMVPAEARPAAAAEASAADPEPLAEAIRTTLAARDYQWRLPPGAGDAAETKENDFWTAMAGALKKVRDLLREFDRLITEAERILRRWMGGETADPSFSEGAAGGLTGDALRGILYLSGVAVAIGLLIGLFYFWRARRKPAAGGVAAGAAPSSINLEDEAMLASALPEDEWLRLARAQWDGGDLRLAVRAVFLATLASLGEQRLVEIARSKSNRDYVAELRVRAAARREAPEIFGRSVNLFERAWYGLHDVAPTWVQELLDNHQRLTSHVRATS